MPWVEVECPNEKCPGREAHHGAECACKGTMRVLRDDGPGTEDCTAGEVTAPRWEAFWFNHTLTREGEWHDTIHCPNCGEEGEEIG